jgi:hypothetical protein
MVQKEDLQAFDHFIASYSMKYFLCWNGIFYIGNLKNAFQVCSARSSILECLALPLRAE